MQQYWVRVGLLGQVGRFRSSDGRLLARGDQVICRTPRGLEVGELLVAVEWSAENWDGDVIRAMTGEDRLLWQRLVQHQADAFQACARLLAEHPQSAVLMDVEPLFDGSALYFYFLGEPSPEVADLTAQLAETYESVAQIRRFGDVLTQGCGPDCGTADGQGCGSSCAGCAVACAVEAARR